MKKAVQRLLPSRSQVNSSTISIKKCLKLDNINLVEDFFIELDDPHKTWSPGETITGTTTLDLKKNATNFNITLALVGYIKVKPGNTTTPARNKPTVLFNHTAIIYGHDPRELPDDVDGAALIGLSKGEHRFPFSMKLPRKNIYTSITFEKGSIAYFLRASINHNVPTSPQASLTSSPASIYSASSTSSSSANILPYNKNSIQHCDKNIQIVVPINVAKVPKPQTKMAYLRLSEKKLRKTLSSTSTVNSSYTQTTNTSDHSTGSSSDHQQQHTTTQSIAQAAKSSPIRLAVDIPQSGYLRGELIPIKVNVSHYKPIQSSNGIIATLIRICRVDNGPESSIQSFRKDLCQTITPLYIDPESLTASVSTSLKVPVDAFPTIVGSEVVSFQYYIEVLANVSSKNLIPGGSNVTSSNPNGSSKFSHSIVFDLDSSRDREMTKSLENGGIINVDKLKRARNLLGLNTEIIVGTERTVKTKTNIGKQTIVQNAMLQNGGTTQVGCEGPPYVAGSESSIFEAMSQTSISPLSINGNPSNVVTVGSNMSHSAGEGIQSGGIGLSEKELLRMREEALLPSEPSYHIDGPAPSYAVNSSDSTPSAPPSALSMDSEPSTSPTAPSFAESSLMTKSKILPSDHLMNEDKQELERRRLEQLESDPPEFDYVPEYLPPTIGQYGSLLGRPPHDHTQGGYNNMPEQSPTPSTVPSVSALTLTSNELETLRG